MVSIVIVNYNTGDLLARCLASIMAHVVQSYEVIVVDNCSSDHSLERLPPMERLTVLREKSNWGFAKACNLGAAQASGLILHFLNPDTEVGDDINAAYQQLGNGLYSTKIVDQNDIEVKTCFAFPTLGNLARILFKTEAPSCWYIGASVVLRAELFRRLGGFSADYRLYAEDEDLFYKAHLAGVPIGQLDARVKHHQGTSSRQIWSARQRLLRVESSGWIFARKFHLRFSYIVFRHAGFVKGLWREPVHTLLEFLTFWQVLLLRPDHSLPGGR